MNILTATMLASLSTTPTPATQSNALPAVVAMHAAYVACDVKFDAGRSKPLLVKAFHETGLVPQAFEAKVRDAAIILVRDLSLSGRLPDFCASMARSALTPAAQ